MKPLLILFACLATSLSFAQFGYRGELIVGADTTIIPGVTENVGWTLAAHLEADYELEPLTFNLQLDPSLRVSDPVTAEPGLTEAYVAAPVGVLELSAGIERLPLEYARLTLPFNVERVNRRGVRLGVPGVRAVLYADPYRVRGAVFYQDVLTPLVSVRRSFGTFELEATALYRDGFVAGLGGSGAVGDLVVYGEGWLLTGGPLNARGALGVTGFLGNRLWTLEAAYAPLITEAFERGEDLLPAAPRLAGQIALLQGGDSSLELDARVGFPDTGFEVVPTLSYTAFGNQELVALLGVRFGDTPTAVSLSVSVRSFF